MRCDDPVSEASRGMVAGRLDKGAIADFSAGDFAYPFSAPLMAFPWLDVAKLERGTAPEDTRHGQLDAADLAEGERARRFRSITHPATYPNRFQAAQGAVPVTVRLARPPSP